MLHALRVVLEGTAQLEAVDELVEVAGLLVGGEAEIAPCTTLAQPAIPAKLRRSTASKLRRANDRKDNLTEHGSVRTGTAAFMANVDNAQVDAQVAVLTNAQTLVTA